MELNIIQTFQGTVYEVSENELEVLLEDLTNTKEPNVFAKIRKDKIQEANTYVVGSMFTWSTGYCKSVDGVIKRYSKIEKIDLGIWTEEDIEKMKNESNKYKEFFKGNSCE